MKWWLKCVRDNYANFRGRARRREYWMFILFNILFGLIAMLLDNLFGTTFSFGEYGYSYGGTAYGFAATCGWIYAIFALATLIPTLAVTVRRLHDTGNNGWLLLWFYLAYMALGIVLAFVGTATPMRSGYGILALIASFGMFALAIWLLVLLCRDSDPGNNRFGSNPKG